MLDDKDLLTDALLDSLFGYQWYNWEGREALGFIAGYPTYVDYSLDEMNVFFSIPYVRDKEQIESWKRQVVENLTEIEDIDICRSHFDILCEDANLVYSFIIGKASVTVIFRHYDEELA